MHWVQIEIFRHANTKQILQERKKKRLLPNPIKDGTCLGFLNKI